METRVLQPATRVYFLEIFQPLKYVHFPFIHSLCLQPISLPSQSTSSLTSRIYNNFCQEAFLTGSNEPSKGPRAACGETPTDLRPVTWVLIQKASPHPNPCQKQHTSLSEAAYSGTGFTNQQQQAHHLQQMGFEGRKISGSLYLDILPQILLFFQHSTSVQWRLRYLHGLL